MSKRYHESREAQMDKKIHGLVFSQHENMFYPRSQSMQTEDILKKELP